MPESRFSVLPWIILVALSVATVSTAGCVRRKPLKAPAEQKPPPASLEEPKDDKLEAEFERAVITWDDDKGRRVWKAEFREALASQTGESAAVELHDVKAHLYKAGKIVSRLVAPKVVADSRTREVRASGGVKVTSAADDTAVRAERIIWKSQEHKLLGVGAVKMTRGDMEITAHRFEADTGMRTARFSDGEGNAG